MKHSKSAYDKPVTLYEVDDNSNNQTIDSNQNNQNNIDNNNDNNDGHNDHKDNNGTAINGSQISTGDPSTR
jgi:hypothetical protein